MPVPLTRAGEEHVRGSAVRGADRVHPAEPGPGGRGTLPSPLQHHRDQDAHECLYVPRLPRHEAHLPRPEVRSCGENCISLDG
jgi:hypothetical protein